MIKILKEKSASRDGNHCVICSSVVLIEFSDTNYTVVSTEQFCGSGMGYDINTSTWSFMHLHEAEAKFDQLAKLI